MQRLRRTFRGVMQRDTFSLSYTKSGAIAEEKGVDGKVLLRRPADVTWRTLMRSDLLPDDLGRNPY